MDAKKELRKKAREIRHSLDIQKISEKIVKNIRQLELYKTAQNVMIFYPLDNEVNLLSLLIDNKNFYLPKVQGESLEVCPYKEGDDLTESKYKSKEPLRESVNANILDIIFVPALSVDKNFNRLGYGGGFYDRFLSTINKKIVKIVAIPKVLIAEKIPSDFFDVKIDIIICEEMVFKPSPLAEEG